MFRDQSLGRRVTDASGAPALFRPDRLVEALIDHEQIALAFQPQIDCRTGAVAGVEALSRWRGADDADKLFKRAAAAGLSERLSRLAQRRAMRIAAAWEGPLKGLGVSINLLPEDIGAPNFDAWLLDEVALAGLDPARLTVEITEGALLADPTAAAERLRRLKGEGISVALDDFGTGYASLAYLVELPLDWLKIDRGLVATLIESERSRIVVHATIQLARDLGLKTVVEGVETQAQLQLLSEWGCDLYQGFLGAPALDEVSLAHFVQGSNVAA